MFTIRGALKKNFLYWEAGAALYDGQIVEEDTGAKPIATGHSGATILGVVFGDTDSGDTAKIYPIGGEVLEVPYLSSATKTSCDDDDLGTAFDVDVTSDEMTVDLDDTTGGILHLVGYDNDRQVAYVVIDETDLLIH